MDEAVLGLTARVVAGYVSNNRLSGEQLPELIEAVYRPLSTAEAAVAAEAAQIEPAVFADHLACLACGASFSMLKRHLKTEHQLTPIEYRARYGLPHDYPIVAPDYAKVRSRLAKKNGLGRGRNPRLAAKRPGRKGR